MSDEKDDVPILKKDKERKRGTTLKQRPLSFFCQCEKSFHRWAFKCGLDYTLEYIKV